MLINWSKHFRFGSQSGSVSEIFDLILETIASQEGACKDDRCNVQADVRNQENGIDDKEDETEQSATNTISVA